MKNYTLLSSIGNTPLIELKNINKNSKVKIFAKFEGANPGGSIKDRTALFMIEAAEKSGQLKKGATKGDLMIMNTKSFGIFECSFCILI